jgi:hypothetical protein
LKFKFLFLFFNFTIIIFLLILFFMPFLILGEHFSPIHGESFLRPFWPLAAILIAVLIVLNIYYFSNRRLFRLLEREDWPALAEYLETRLPRRGRYPEHLVRLYANTCLVLSDSQAVLNLENKLALVKPVLVEKNVLLFGTARILGKDYSGALRFFAAHDRRTAGGPVRGTTGKTAGPGTPVSKGPFPGSFLRSIFKFFAGDRVRQAQWIALYHGFTLLLDRRFEEAAEKFRLLAEEGEDPLAAALSAWFLADNLSKIVDGSGEAAQAARERIRSSLPRRKDWEKETAKTETEIHAAILRSYINEAGNWIYNP